MHCSAEIELVEYSPSRLNYWHFFDQIQIKPLHIHIREKNLNCLKNMQRHKNVNSIEKMFSAHSKSMALFQQVNKSIKIFLKLVILDFWITHITYIMICLSFLFCYTAPITPSTYVVIYLAYLLPVHTFHAVSMMQ